MEGRPTSGSVEKNIFAPHTHRTTMKTRSERPIAAAVF